MDDNVNRRHEIDKKRGAVFNIKLNQKGRHKYRFCHQYDFATNL